MISVTWREVLCFPAMVNFRLVMFRPFVGEVLIAKLKRCDKAGLYLSLGSFFEDRHIPEHLLQQPSVLYSLVPLHFEFSVYPFDVLDMWDLEKGLCSYLGTLLTYFKHFAR
ncbi:hypothetical protein M758_6G036600 [Ceratodon purpureus]|nr:hypothetical protein M758_6G036600 [Ceratodon purpureus]